MPFFPPFRSCFSFFYSFSVSICALIVGKIAICAVLFMFTMRSMVSIFGIDKMTTNHGKRKRSMPVDSVETNGNRTATIKPEFIFALFKSESAEKSEQLISIAV